ncbi:MAG: histidine--tRNA ligase [Actinomycetia bacterium]|nr:histidine--tRNA ligase [Actinomycetes bacterium]MCP5030562.1 histidine--tRNA ligase [Actinomycetes bacterium]
MSRKSKRPQARLPRGLVDASGRDVLQRQEMINTILPVYQRFGFQPLETPELEYLDALGKFLPDKDRPGEGVFALRDDDEQWMALRYDLTAPLARYVAQNRNELTMPYRRYQAGPVFRQEKPGPGRFRQFYQCDFDTVGSRSMAVDAEVCALLVECMEALGIEAGNYLVRVNDRKVLNGVLNQAGIATAGADASAEDTALAEAKRAHVLRSVDKLDRIGIDGVRQLLGAGREDESGDFTLGVDLADDQIEQVLGFVSAGASDGVNADERPKVLARLDDLVGNDEDGRAGVAELEIIDALLSSMGIGSDQVVFDTTVVRGLDYYTGPVFEAELTFDADPDGGTPRSFGSVAAGGRYDDLIKRFTGQEVPACGASIGVDRLLTALRTLDKIDQSGLAGPVVVTIMDSDRLPDYQAMVSELRQAGIAAELYLGNKNIGNQLKYADRRRSPAAIIAGSNEFDDNTVVVKNLAYGKEVSQDISDREEWLKAADVQQTVSRESLVETVRSLID